jgi:hypothetical protein
MVFGDGELPVRLHGKDRLDGDDSNGQIGSKEITCHCQSRMAGKDSVGRGECESVGADGLPSTPTNARPGSCHQEGISFTKVCRADRIRTCDLLTPSQTRYQTAPRPEYQI